MKTPVAFLLGAGASLPYGIPVMTGFYCQFKEFVNERHPHCFPLIERFEKNGIHERPDLESLLSDLGHVLSIEKAFHTLGEDSESLKRQIELARELRGYLDAFIIDTCERYDRTKAAAELKSLIEISRNSPLWIFSTNYDRIVEHSCDSAGIAWSDGFEVDQNHPVADWTGNFPNQVRLVKLHGSVNWYEDDPGQGLHRLDRGYALPAHDFRLVRGNQELKPLMIIPTLEKEALGIPYISLSVIFTDVLANTRLLIVAGNSLRDKHIRAYIKSRVNTLFVLLISPSADRSTEILDCPDRTFALPTGFSEFLTLGASAFSDLVEGMMNDQSEEGLKAKLDEFIVNAGKQVQTADLKATHPELFAVFEHLRSGSTSARISALGRLAVFSHPSVVGQIIDVLEDDADERVRAAAIDALVGRSGLEAIPVLSQILQSDDSPLVLSEAILALHGLGSEGDAALKFDTTRKFPAEVEVILKEILPELEK